MSTVSTAVAEIALEKGINPKEVTSDMVYEAVGKEKQISKEMIDILLGLLKGSVSIEEIPNFESTYSNNTTEIEDEIERLRVRRVLSDAEAEAVFGESLRKLAGGKIKSACRSFDPEKADHAFIKFLFALYSLIVGT